MKTKNNGILKLGLYILAILYIVSCAKEDPVLDSEATGPPEGYERVYSLNVVLPDDVNVENTVEFIQNATSNELRNYQNAYIIVDYLRQLDMIDTIAAQEKKEILEWNLSQYLDEAQVRTLRELLISPSEIMQRGCIRRIYERVCETRKTTCYRSVPIRYSYPHPMAPRIKYYRKIPYTCYKTSCRNNLIRVESC